MKKAIELFLIAIIIFAGAVFIYAFDEDSKDVRKQYPAMEDSVRQKLYKNCNCQPHKHNYALDFFAW